MHDFKGTFYNKVIVNFSAAHKIDDYFFNGENGKCSNIHGHNWKLIITIKGSKLDSCGMLLDFAKAKKIARQIAADLDHKFLNELGFFAKKPPSTENVCLYFYQELADKLNTQDIKISKLTLWENSTNCAEFEPAL